MKKKIEKHPNFEDFSKELIKILQPTYEDNIEEIDGYENLNSDIKIIISTHKLIPSISLGSIPYKGKDLTLSGFRCENCGTSFILTPTLSPSHLNKRSIYLNNDTYIECFNFVKCLYSLKPS